MKTSIVWWVGWIVLFPLRLAFCAIFCLCMAMRPSLFYGIWNDYDLVENDSDKWKF